MPEEQLPPKSTRTYEKWKEALSKMIERKEGYSKTIIDDNRAKPYYDRALMPEVCFKEIYNR